MIECTEAEQIERLNARVVELLTEREALRKALEKIEYASRKDSLTEHERLSSVRIVVCAAISSLSDEQGK
jgi:hypothetical protein